MAPQDIVASAAYAAGGRSCPLPQQAGDQPLTAPALSPDQQLALLAAALAALDSSGASAGSALQRPVQQLRRRHALLAACSRVATACARHADSSQWRATKAVATALQRDGLAGDGRSDSSPAASAVLRSYLKQLLTTGCPAAAVVRAAAVLQALLQAPEQAPADPDALLSQPDAATAAQTAAAAAAKAAVGTALRAMSGGSAGAGEAQLSAGDAVQNLFALLRSLHQQPAVASPSSASDPNGAAEEAEAPAAAAVAAAVDALRLLVWQQLQRTAAAYDGSGGAAETEAHLQASGRGAFCRRVHLCSQRYVLIAGSHSCPLQVLELLGSVGSAAMWPGWRPPAGAVLSAGAGPLGSPGGSGAGFRHHQALLFTRTAAMLAQEWPAAVQQCRLSAADFSSAEAAEAALLRMAAAAEDAAQLRLLLRIMAEALPDAAFAASEAEGPEAGAPAPAPLHRARSACLRALLPLGDLAGVLVALDERHAQRGQQAEQQQQRAALALEEAESLAEVADATQGTAAAAAVALLLPYSRLQRARWQQLLQDCGGGAPAEAAAALPGLADLLLLLAQRQPELLIELASGGRQQQQLFQHLVAAGLQQQQQQGGYAAGLGGGLTLRAAVAAAAAVQLAGARLYTAAGWLAMQACGTPRLLRVLDRAPRALQQLLRSCAAGSPAAAHAAAAADSLADGGGPPGVALPHTAALLLRGLGEECNSAVAQLAADLQLQQ